MKKIHAAVLVVFALLALLLSSCSHTPDPKTDLKLPVTVTACLNNGESQFITEISTTGFNVYFGEEHSLYGTFLDFNNGSGTASVGDFTRNVTPEMFPAQNALAKALQLINQAENKPIKTEKGFKYAIDEMTIMVYYDSDAESIIGIETEENGRRFYFNIAALKPYEKQSNGEGQS